MADKIPLTLPYKYSLLLPRLRTVLDIIGWPTDAYGMLKMAKENPKPNVEIDCGVGLDKFIQIVRDNPRSELELETMKKRPLPGINTQAKIG